MHTYIHTHTHYRQNVGGSEYRHPAGAVFAKHCRQPIGATDLGGAARRNALRLWGSSGGHAEELGDPGPWGRGVAGAGTVWEGKGHQDRSKGGKRYGKVTARLVIFEFQQ